MAEPLLRAAPPASIGVKRRRTRKVPPERLSLPPSKQGRKGTAPADPIAVVIPVLNEAPRIGGLLNDLRAQGYGRVVVVDGGSRDGSEAAAREGGAEVLRGPAGRAAQMNVGAAATDTSVLLFLHADTRLPAGSRQLILDALETPVAVGGCFGLRFDSSLRLLDLYAWFSRFDSRITSFGDQAFFVRRTAFQRSEGFPEWPLLEDVELRRRLKRQGRFVKIPRRVVASSRRFDAEGPIRRQLGNGLILLLHALGAPAHRLKRWYR